DHYQAFFNHVFSPALTFSAALFLTHGEGYYEEYKYSQHYSDYGLPDLTVGNVTVSKTDLVRQLWLNNDLYGTNLSLAYKKGKLDAALGGNFSRFRGHHHGDVLWGAEGGVPKDY